MLSFFLFFALNYPFFALNYLISASYFLKTALLLANQNREIFVCILLNVEFTSLVVNFPIEYALRILQMLIPYICVYCRNSSASVNCKVTRDLQKENKYYQSHLSINFRPEKSGAVLSKQKSALSS